MEERDYRFVKHENPYTYRDGDLTVTRGSAWSGPGCHLGCGVLLYTNDEGELVKVEGDPENPFNEGRLCVRCLDLPEMVHNPKRLTHPLRRAKADRGRDRWERIGWDEALDLIACELNKVKEEHGPESVTSRRRRWRSRPRRGRRTPARRVCPARAVSCPGPAGRSASRSRRAASSARGSSRCPAA